MKILIIRTIQSDLLGLLLNRLREEFQMAEISILDNRKQTAFVAAQKNIRKVFLTKTKGDYCAGNISWQTLSEIRRENFDKVIVPHKQFDQIGFENVIFLLYFLGVKAWFHCSIDWKLKSINKSNVLKLFLNQTLSVPLFIILVPVGLSAFIYLFVVEKILKLRRADLPVWKCGLEDIKVKIK